MKDYSKMTSKKLNALIESASDEERAKIQAELDMRAEAAATEVGGVNTDEVIVGEELTPEEQALLDQAEANGGVNPAAEDVNKKSKKLTLEELETINEECKKNIGHKCQVVPFNTLEWANGTIVGTMIEKRANKVLYAIKLEDGKRIVKVYNSTHLKVLDEVVDIKIRERSGRTASAKTEWLEDEINEAIAETIGNVGKQVSLGDGVIGRIVAIVPEKRTHKIMYRINVPAPTEEDPQAVKVVHKVHTADFLNSVYEELDEEGQELNAKYLDRRTNLANKVPVTPQDRVLKCQDNLKKAEETLAKAQAALAKRQVELADAQAELEKYLSSQEAAAETSVAAPEAVTDELA